MRRLLGGQTGRCGSRNRVRENNSGDALYTAALHAIRVGLSERFVRGGVGEIVRAIRGAVFNEETSALEAAFILVEQFAFGVKKFRALFTSDGNICSGGEGSSLRGIVIVARGATERRFAGVVASTRRIVVLLGDTLVFFPLGAQHVVT